jgi:hypothetical protein
MLSAARRVARSAVAAVTTAPPLCAGWAAPAGWAHAASPALAIGGARALQHAASSSSSSSTDIRAVMAEKVPVQQVRGGSVRT